MKVALPVIVVTAQGDVKSAVRAMKAGAVDFIEKPYGDEALVGAIESALKPAAPTDRSAEIAEAAARIAQLSPREREVLCMRVAYESWDHWRGKGGMRVCARRCHPRECQNDRHRGPNAPARESGCD
jgi:response regulator RpfG family c-di-GMP phosphodiesterase